MISILKISQVKLFLSVIPLVLGGFSVSWGTSYPFELARPLYVGARALGMGNAFTGVADDVTAGFWNPAGLIQWQGVKIFGMTKIYDRQDYAFDPKGIGYSYRGNAFFWGNKIALGVDSGTPDFNYYSVARQMGSYVAVGLSLKFKRQHPANYYQFFGRDFSYDVAILSRPSPRIQIGVLMQNLPRKRVINPVSFGFSYRCPRVIVSTDFVFSASEIAASEIHLGAEWQFNKYLCFRAGISETHPTFGLGIMIRCLRLDYAWIREDSLDSHFVSAEFKG